MYPPGPLSQAALYAVLPNPGGQINFAFRRPGPKYWRNDYFFTHGKFVFYDVARRIRRVQHPQRPYQRHGRLQCFLDVSFQQRIYLYKQRQSNADNIRIYIVITRQSIRRLSQVPKTPKYRRFSDLFSRLVSKI